MQIPRYAFELIYRAGTQEFQQLFIVHVISVFLIPVFCRRKFTYKVATLDFPEKEAPYKT